MTTAPRLPAGTPAWLEMVGTLMCEAALAEGEQPGRTLSLVERYIDGSEIAPGLWQGLRFDLVAGVPSFRVGVAQDEAGDVTIEITADAARILNRLHSTDPGYASALERFQRSGSMRVEGDPSDLGPWLAEVHDAIVARTL